MSRSPIGMRGVRSLAVVTIGFLAAVACGSGTGNNSGNGAAKDGGTVTLASWQEPDSMLSAGITDSMTHAVADVAPVMEGLLSLTAQDDIPANPKISDYYRPQLATEVPTVDNGDVKVNSDGTMAVTWKLRQNVKWHDGQPFGADDVVDTVNFWWLKYKDKNPTPLVSTSGWDQMSAVKKIDDHTVEVDFSKTFGPYLGLLDGPYGVLPSHLLKKSWDAGGDLTKTKLAVDNTPANPDAFKGTEAWDRFLVGTGPYVFKEWVSGDHLTLVKNKNWWGGAGHLDKITIKFEPDTNGQLADLRTGTIDAGVDFRAALLSPLGHLANVTTVVLKDTGAEHIDLNLKNTYLADKTIRKALLMGIDRQKMVDTLVEGKTVIPPDSWLCLGLAGWCADPSIPTTKYDPDAAKKMLDDAGYKVDKTTKIRTFSDGTPISLNLSTTSGNALREQQEVQIASDLKAIGIDIKSPFTNARSGQFFGAYASGGIIYNHKFDMAQYTNTFPGGEPDAAYSGYVCDQIPTAANGGVGQNTTQLCDPVVDAAFKKGRAAVAQSDRKAAYVDAQKQLAADLADLSLYQQLTVNAYSKKLGGYKGNADVWFNNAADWYVAS